MKNLTIKKLVLFASVSCAISLYGCSSSESSPPSSSQALQALLDAINVQSNDSSYHTMSDGVSKYNLCLSGGIYFGIDHSVPHNFKEINNEAVYLKIGQMKNGKEDLSSSSDRDIQNSISFYNTLADNGLFTRSKYTDKNGNLFSNVYQVYTPTADFKKYSYFDKSFGRSVLCYGNVKADKVLSVLKVNNQQASGTFIATFNTTITDIAPWAKSLQNTPNSEIDAKLKRVPQEMKAMVTVTQDQQYQLIDAKDIFANI